MDFNSKNTKLSNSDFDLRPLGEILEADKSADDKLLKHFWLKKKLFCSPRHEFELQPLELETQTWRMKERMKTVSVALVLCLNIGVDPPDVIKIMPCAKQLCWIDPKKHMSDTSSAQKPIEIIGAALQKQYERWQPRARYKLSLDPVLEEVKKLLTSLRRNAKEDRVLLHFNGFGVPRPTENGEIWVFNKQYTQYMPLSMCDLQLWMGRPSIYVFDCSNAGHMLASLQNILKSKKENKDSEGKQSILLAACQSDESLPQSPDLPADLFTACLTTPIKVALKWYISCNISKLVPAFTNNLVDEIPGQLNDRRTMLGELNWIFTAITDTIAWSVLSRELFQRLFRQDLLVASLFRNFLLAVRVMGHYHCHPMSLPSLPATKDHPMWLAWDYALDGILKQVPAVLQDPSSFQHSNFFSQQLTGFQVWLSTATSLVFQQFPAVPSLNPPLQLPIVLQVLLSQIHRQRALELLASFLDLGAWAVNLALSVGIFPYVLKLLQSSARELKPLLVFIWAKLLAVDSSCQTDLIKDNGHKYFTCVLADASLKAEDRMLAAFVLSLIVDGYDSGKEAMVKGNGISTCLLQLHDDHPGLKLWAIFCLSKTWQDFDTARWVGVRDSAHEKLALLLRDPCPEIRAAAVYSLGSFLTNNTDRDEHVMKLDQSIASHLLPLLHDASPVVRREVLLALVGFVNNFMLDFISSSLLYQTSVSHMTTSPGMNTMSESENKKDNSEMHRMKPRYILKAVWDGINLLKSDPHPRTSEPACILWEEMFKRLQSGKRTTKPPTSSGDNKPPPIKDPRLESTFFRWCCRQFSEPNSKMKMHSFFHPDYHPSIPQSISESSLDEQHPIRSKVGSVAWYKEDMMVSRAARVVGGASEEYDRIGSSRLDELVTSFKLSRPTNLMTFHPFENTLAVVQDTHILMYDSEHGDGHVRLDTSYKPYTKITHLSFLNPHHLSTILTANNEGQVKAWSTEKGNQLVTSFIAVGITKVVKDAPGVLIDWRHEKMVACGSVPYIRLWDLDTEMLAWETPLRNRDEYSTAVSMMGRDAVVVGMVDGGIRLFDLRTQSETKEYREGMSRVMRVCPTKNNLLLSASVSGEVNVWDMRTDKLAHKYLSSEPINVFDCHTHANLFVCNTSGNLLSSFDQQCQQLYQLKSKAASPYNFITLHPYKVKLATSTTNNLVSIYTLKK